MTTLEIEQLFDNNRLPAGLYMLPVLLYFPVGLLLALLRLFIGFHVFLISCILPKMSSFRMGFLRTLCGVLGVIVSLEGSEKRDPKVKVMVANYTSTLDHLATDLVMPCILPCVWDLPPLLMWLIGYTDMGAKQGRDTLIANAKKHIKSSKAPMLVFPEGASTNGKKGLLKFSVWPFSLDHQIQPVLIRVSRPYIKVSPSVLGGRWWIDVFWFLFVPYTTFHIRILEPVDIGEEETPTEYTRRAEALIADGLSIKATQHTSADKVEYAKRKLFVVRSNSAPMPRVMSTATLSPVDHQLAVMTRQVKEVLPHVPVHIIQQDLGQTQDVDVTITNILEGNIDYSQQQEPVNFSQQASQNTSSPAPKPTVGPKLAETAADKFASRPGERQLSLEDRKKALIETARRRYMEKHNML